MRTAAAVDGRAPRRAVRGDGERRATPNSHRKPRALLIDPPCTCVPECSPWRGLKRPAAERWGRFDAVLALHGRYEPYKRLDGPASG